MYYNIKAYIIKSTITQIHINNIIIIDQLPVLLTVALHSTHISQYPREDTQKKKRRDTINVKKKNK